MNPSRLLSFDGLPRAEGSRAGFVLGLRMMFRTWLHVIPGAHAQLGREPRECCLFSCLFRRELLTPSGHRGRAARPTPSRQPPSRSSTESTADTQPQAS